MLGISSGSLARRGFISSSALCLLVVCLAPSASAAPVDQLRAPGSPLRGVNQGDGQPPTATPKTNCSTCPFGLPNPEAETTHCLSVLSRGNWTPGQEPASETPLFPQVASMHMGGGLVCAVHGFDDVFGPLLDDLGDYGVHTTTYTLDATNFLPTDNCVQGTLFGGMDYQVGGEPYHAEFAALYAGFVAGGVFSGKIIAGSEDGNDQVDGSLDGHYLNQTTDDGDFLGGSSEPPAACITEDVGGWTVTDLAINATYAIADKSPG
jgi:hypothetical protein